MKNRFCFTALQAAFRLICSIFLLTAVCRNSGNCFHCRRDFLPASGSPHQRILFRLLCYARHRLWAWKPKAEICDYTNLTPSAAGSLLSSLASRNLVSRIVPVTENQGSRRALYLISDGIFRFWYTCVLPYLSEIEVGEGAQVFEKQIVPLLEDYTIRVFPDICRDFLELEEKAGRTPFPMQRIGRWWGQHPTKKRTEYISIAAYSRDNIMLGACFWTEDWLDVDALYDLQKHASLFPDEEQWYYLFSKSDFVSGFETISGNHVHVFSLEKMCRMADEYLSSTI